MTREKKYPDTATFHFHNQNPKNRITGDCVFRAISLATNKPYNECVMEMAKVMCKTGYALNDKKGEDAYLKSIGWIKMPQPKKADGTKYTGKEFCELLARKGVNYIAHIGGHHMICIKDQKVWDIWNSTSGKIGNYWIESTMNKYWE